MKIVLGTDERLRTVARVELSASVDAVEVMGAETFSRERLIQLATGQALFGERFGVVLDRVGEHAGSRTELLAALVELPQSSCVVVFEEKPDKEYRMALESLGVPIVTGAVSEAVRFSPFAFTDAVAGRNKKDAWLKWHEALAAGEDPNYMHAMLVWQLRAMLVASRFTQADSDMKPFTYSKAKKAATEFKPGEIERLCRKSIELHAHSRTTDGADISFLVERFLLAL